MSKVHPFHLLAAAVLLSATHVHAASYALSFGADADCRWYDFFMGYFAELARTDSGNPPPNVMYSIDAETDPLAPTVYEDAGVDAVVFAHGTAWNDIGSLTYSGSGDGTFAISAVTLDVSPFVDIEEASAMGTPYRTEVSNVSGTITLSGGSVTDLQLQADIRFLQRMYNPDGELPFDGTIVVDGDHFDIFVDDEFSSHGGTLHYVWDLHGSVAGVGGDGDVVFRDGFDGR